jgi:hypothetical protein
MPATYSISVGGPTEASRKQDINSVLLDLPDNSQKLISPKDVRDAFVTTWATSAFKQTIGKGGIEYLGIDSGDPNNRDIKQKIFIGKRNYAGSDIMNNSLLANTNNDIYIYNTKSDTSSTQSTTIAILAGTNSTLHSSAPYIQSNVVNSGNALSLEMINPSAFAGPINIYSNTGRIAINGVLFPTVDETSASASNGKILKYSGTYPNGVLRWADPTVSISNIGSVGVPTNIYGSPSNVNGYSLEFIDSSAVPSDVGGVAQGSSFSAGSYNGQNWPLSEVIRKILYPYLPPVLSLNVTIDGVEYLTTGLTYSALFDYSITRYSYDVSSYNITGTTYSGLSFSGVVGSQLNTTFNSNIYSNTTVTNNLLNTLPYVSGFTQSYALRASDNQYILLSFSHSATASVKFVHPSFYGFDLNQITSSSLLGSFINSSTRLTLPYLGSPQSISLSYNGSGYVYFVVPNIYPLLSKIKDPNGFIIHDSTLPTTSAFTYSTYAPSGGNNLPSPVPSYRVYRTIGTCSYNTGATAYPGSSGNFEFIF